uniref:Sperm-associated antigen 17 n=1 Tax=Angiostrongylus cantonensis TaxID=6313 RepID=A0A0K0D9E2_ANGCA
MLHGYVFECLDKCECDTEDEVIHCHNGDRIELQLPQGERLRGFPVIGLTYNQIVRLPDEATLLTKFPDLMVVDVERNPDFDCDSLKEYERIKIVSDCYKNITEIDRVPRIYRPSLECDFACQAAKHYANLHGYVLHLWEILKEKYRNFSLDATLRQVQEFFQHLVSRVNQFGKDVQMNLKKQSKPPHPKYVTPMPELEEVVGGSDA